MSDKNKAEHDQLKDLLIQCYRNTLEGTNKPQVHYMNYMGKLLEISSSDEITQNMLETLNNQTRSTAQIENEQLINKAFKAIDALKKEPIENITKQEVTWRNKVAYWFIKIFTLGIITTKKGHINNLNNAVSKLFEINEKNNSKEAQTKTRANPQDVTKSRERSQSHTNLGNYTNAVDNERRKSCGGVSR
jgi:hypothetical protein